MRVEQLVASYAELRECVRERGRRDLSFASPRVARDRRAQDELAVRIALAALASSAHPEPPCGSIRVSERHLSAPPVEILREPASATETGATASAFERVRVVCADTLIRIATPLTRALALKSLIRMSLPALFP